jgi:hypothetical protein
VILSSGNVGYHEVWKNVNCRLMDPFQIRLIVARLTKNCLIFKQGSYRVCSKKNTHIKNRIFTNLLTMANNKERHLSDGSHSNNSYFPPIDPMPAKSCRNSGCSSWAPWYGAQPWNDMELQGLTNHIVKVFLENRPTNIPKRNAKGEVVGNDERACDQFSVKGVLADYVAPYRASVLPF